MAKQKGGPSKGRQPQPAEDDGGIYVSGKLVIIIIVVLAVAGAGFSWWFRYMATRRAARFWGPGAVLLIRDAPTVYLIDVGPMDAAAEHAHDPGSRLPDHFHAAGGLWTVIDRRDVSRAHGLTHVREGLLLDRNLTDVGLSEVLGETWRSGLEFRAEGARPLLILFSSDYKSLLGQGPDLGDRAQRIVPIAAWLETVFDDWRSAPAANTEN